jgi:hypothetical protein
MESSDKQVLNNQSIKDNCEDCPYFHNCPKMKPGGICYTAAENRKKKEQLEKKGDD